MKLKFVILNTTLLIGFFAQNVVAQNDPWYTLSNQVNTANKSGIQCSVRNSYNLENSTIKAGQYILPKEEGTHLTCTMKKQRMDITSSPAFKTYAANKVCNPQGTNCTITLLVNGQWMYTYPENTGWSWWGQQNSPHPFCSGQYPVYTTPGDPSSSVNLCDYINKANMSTFASNATKLTLDDIFGPRSSRTKDVYILGESVYKHDVTDPTCSKGIITYKDTGKLYDGNWTYKVLTKKGKCEDTLSGCKTLFSSPENVFKYNGVDYFRVILEDRAKNKGGPKCPAIPMLIDIDTPLILGDVTLKNSQGQDIASISQNDIEIDKQNDGELQDGKYGDEVNPNEPRYFAKNLGTIDIYASPIDLKFQVRDPKIHNGVSGIKEVAYIAHVCGNTSQIIEHYKQTFDSYNPNGLDKPFDDRDVILKSNTFSKKEGCYDLEIKVTDWTGNYSQFTLKVNVVPNLEISTKLITSDSGRYANNLDKYNYKACFEDSYGNSIHDKSFSNLTYQGTGILLPNKNSALNFSGRSFVTDANGCGNFSVSSYMPGTVYHDFTMDYVEWDTKYASNGNRKTTKLPTTASGPSEFLKLYTSDMDFASGGIIDTDPVTARMVIGAMNEIKLQETKEGADFSKINESTITIDNTQLEPPVTDGVTAPYTFFGTGADDSSDPRTCDFLGATFRSICFYAQALRGITSKDELNIWARPMVSYDFTNGTSVKYQLSPTPTGLSNEPVTLSGGTLNGIYIGGQQRSNGKDGIVSNMENIGGLKGFEFTNAIRKQVALVTRNRKPNDGKVVNGVFYIMGDQNLSALNNISGWETVIVEDGNLIIDTNFNEVDKSKPRGIIVITKNKTDKGNIYIKPNVVKISAGIFADGSIESVDSNGNIFTKSDMNRTKALTKQLMIYGTILSRNTIGGAILGELGDAYVLPGSEDTKSLDEAVRFDLSFLRMFNYDDTENKWSASNANKDWHQGHSESTVVIPNPKFLSNPPAVFNFKE